MKTLLEVQDELRLARMLVECAFMATSSLQEAEPVHTVLDVASDGLRELGEAIEAIRKTVDA